jgi:hypothetical protein
LDHVFVTSDLKACVANYSIINDHLNPSAHLAVSFCLKHPEVSGCLGASSCVANPYVREFRWDRADLSLYYDKTRELLGKIEHNFDCDESHNICKVIGHRADIDIYYFELVHCLNVAAVSCIPTVPKGALKHYWSVALDDLKSNSKDTYDMWILCGRPRNGPVYDLMRSAKYKYKQAIRNAVKEYENKFSDELYEQLLAKDMFSFWKSWSRRAAHGRVRASCIDGKIKDVDIAEVFKGKFSNIASDVSQLDDNAVNIDEPMHVNINDWLFTVENIDNAVFNQMKRGKAAGIDNLCLEHIIFSHSSIIVHLYKFFNLLLKHEYVPSQFGLGIVIPLLKDRNGNVCSSENYRGITVSPVISKIFELCLLQKFGSFFETHDLQLGFKKNVGCGPAIFTVQQLVKYFTSRGQCYSYCCTGCKQGI